MFFKDYYSILEVLPQANQKEISIAYKTLAKKWHPDINKNIEATTKMQLISEAYEILINPEKRKVYDVRYNLYLLVLSGAELESDTTLAKCYYCSKNTANKKESLNLLFYRVTGRGYNKVWYETMNVEIPRCKECSEIHIETNNVLLFLPPVAFAVLGFILGSTIWSMWFLCLIGGGLLGAILGTILDSINSSISAKESGIKEMLDVSDFELVKRLQKEGWTMEKPTA